MQVIAVAVSMSAIWLKLTALLCVPSTALSNSEGHGVVWREFGGNFTIHCRTDVPHVEFLYMEKGLSKTSVLVKENNKTKTTIAEDFDGRMELNGMFPNLDITITNLSSEDTSPYWCIYKRFDVRVKRMTEFKGTGSVLLVVKGAAPQCEATSKYLVLVSTAVSCVVFFGILIILTMYIFKKKPLHRTMKPQRVATNDVYEDMRGTLRR